ncbi:hypothetical protein [Candidatus Villigracilis saccharophilus]|uniref:hypothetical protein n=1 Tax=Candidatus Villigracilis saccharophilus TaxID=3140684 RepID=UPI0031373FD3|nr:hypothetical protein [Anaerolineales bacterium]
MLTETNRWIFALTVTLLVVLFGMLSLPVQVSAAQVTDATPNSCLTCHENLYYLYDTGKLYCLTDHADRCVNCHEGNAAVMKKKIAFGIDCSPWENNGEKCLECHKQQDAQTRLAIFESEGGFGTVIKAEVYTPPVAVAAGFPNVPETDSFVGKLPWLAGALVLFGLWLILFFSSPQKP